MKYLLIPALMTVALMTGCNTGAGRHATSVQDVQVGILDVTPRPASTAVHAFDVNTAPKQFVHLAHLTVQGYLSDEAKMVSLLASKARELGANGLIMGVSEQPFRGYPASATDQTLRVYRAEAIIYKPN